MSQERENQAKNSFRKMFTLAIIAMVGLLAILNFQMIGFAGEMRELNNALTGMTIGGPQELPSPDIGQIVQQDTLEGYPDILAIVNGEDITREDVATIKSQVDMQGGFMSVEDIVDEMIFRKVLLQEAKNRGHEVSRQDVEDSFMAFGFSPEEAKAEIESYGMDYDEFLESQREELIFSRILEDEKEFVEVTDEEIIALFEAEQEFLGDVTFEEIESDIREFIKNQKAQERMMNLSSELKESADVQLFI